MTPTQTAAEIRRAGVLVPLAQLTQADFALSNAVSAIGYICRGSQETAQVCAPFSAAHAELRELHVELAYLVDKINRHAARLTARAYPPKVPAPSRHRTTATIPHEATA